MITFNKLSEGYIDTIVKYICTLNNYKIETSLITSRVKEMFTQNYECIGIFKDNELIGICGLWYMTKHYSGKSAEVDHVYIKDAYRNKAIGHELFSWLINYLKAKDIEVVELNTYVENSASHKFYYNQGFKVLGFHFLKTL